MTFSQKTLKYVHAGSMVLDLGAGDGWFSRECAARQAIVTAVDTASPSENNLDIDWQTLDVRAYIERLAPENTFDVIYTRNLIQFLDADWVEKSFFPTLMQHLAPMGVIAVQTFFQDPEPPFAVRLSALYTAADIQKLLPGIQTLYQRQFSETTPDMRGITRTFFITNVIGQKTSTP